MIDHDVVVKLRFLQFLRRILQPRLNRLRRIGVASLQTVAQRFHRGRLDENQNRAAAVLILDVNTALDID